MQLKNLIAVQELHWICDVLSNEIEMKVEAIRQIGERYCPDSQNCDRKQRNGCFSKIPWSNFFQRDKNLLPNVTTSRMLMKRHSSQEHPFYEVLYMVESCNLRTRAFHIATGWHHVSITKLYLPATVGKVRRQKLIHFFLRLKSDIILTRMLPLHRTIEIWQMKMRWWHYSKAMLPWSSE